MRQRILLLVAFFLVSHYAYSQHIANAIPVDIPLNSSKESTIQKLLNKGYWLYSTQEKDGYKILEYKKDRIVRLWTKGNIIPIVSWKLYFPSGAELLFNDPEADVIEMELTNVYGIEPYASSVEKGKNGSIEDEFRFFHWKGNTIILGYYELFILSNADAANRYKAYKQEQDKKAKEQQERDVQQQQREVERKAIAQKERDRQEQRERDKVIEREWDMREENMSKEVIQKERATKYSACRFLFDNEVTFSFWITQKYSTMHDEIIRQIDKKMYRISNVVTVGTELSNNDEIRNDLIAMSNIGSNLKDDSIITNLVEKELADFVSQRIYLFVLFRESNKTRYSDFILDYCNGL
ncbi:MAG: hypothetical protein IKX35_02375 [Bacteroidales bacterium]|nr:hypothetical protein [Bacteroidales bacterium]